MKMERMSLVSRLFACLGVVCLLGLVVPTNSLACHKGTPHGKSASCGFQINDAMSDAWFFPGTPGQGFSITVWEDSGFVFLIWFTYDTERPPADVTAILGEPGHRWLSAQGAYEGDTANLTIFVTEGGVFDAAEPAATTDPAGDGTLTIEFADCASGLVSYEITSLGISGEIPIQRILADKVAACEAAQPQ
jgi:hypothetical protein